MAVKIYNVGVSNIRVREQGVFTAPELVTDAGLYIESAGGYYAGANIIVGSKEYAIIVAPKELGQRTNLQWKTTQTNTIGANSTFNGKANMAAIETDGLSKHPAAEFCANLNINGFNDWHLPAPDELEVCYRYLKPNSEVNNTSSVSLHNSNTGANPNSNPIGDSYTSGNPTITIASEFRLGNSQNFDQASYWSSNESNNLYTWKQSFYKGNQDVGLKTTKYWTRAVRWLEV